jgi:hypothetical protein
MEVLSGVVVLLALGLAVWGVWSLPNVRRVQEAVSAPACSVIALKRAEGLGDCEPITLADALTLVSARAREILSLAEKVGLADDGDFRFTDWLGEVAVSNERASELIRQGVASGGIRMKANSVGAFPVHGPRDAIPEPFVPYGYCNICQMDLLGDEPFHDHTDDELANHERRQALKRVK